MTEKVQHASVYEALLAALEDVGEVKKEFSADLGYFVAKEGVILEAVRPAFLKHGLVIMPVANEIVGSETYTTRSGASMNRVRLSITYKIVHAKSGTSELLQVIGEGADAGDKAANKAMTVALKYVLRQTFLLETGDDPDNQSSSGQSRQSRQTSTKKTTGAPPSVGEPTGKSAVDKDKQLASKEAIEAWNALVKKGIEAGVKVPEINPAKAQVGALRAQYRILDESIKNAAKGT